jgi:hypothetical protein
MCADGYGLDKFVVFTCVQPSSYRSHDPDRAHSHAAGRYIGTAEFLPVGFLYEEIADVDPSMAERAPTCRYCAATATCCRALRQRTGLACSAPLLRGR